jgi:hypothetical protein
MRMLAALFLLAQAAPTGARAGDQSTITLESTLDLEFTVRDGQPESKRLISLVRKDRFVQVVTDVSGGKPRAVKLTCLSSTLQRSGTNTPIEEKPTALEGKNYVASAGADGWTALEPDGSAPPIEAVNLGSWNEMGRLLPASEPQTGGSWTVEAKDFFPVFHLMGLVEGEGKLECTCSSAAGGKATIEFKGELQGRPKDPNVSKLSLKVDAGTLVYDLSKGRPVSLKVTGAVETTVDRIEVTRKANASGTIEEERRKIGEILARSTRMEAKLTFE